MLGGVQQDCGSDAVVCTSTLPVCLVFSATLVSLGPSVLQGDTFLVRGGMRTVEFKVRGSGGSGAWGEQARAWSCSGGDRRPCLARFGLRLGCTCWRQWSTQKGCTAAAGATCALLQA